VDGEPLVREKPVYYLVHKPDGYVTTNRDPEGRPRVIDLVADERRLFPVGRLDMHSEGLILVTNDGDLANRLAHPRYEIEKTYHVQVAGHVEPQEMAAIRKGVFLADGRANVERITIKRSHKNSTILEMVLAEGRNREIRRIFAGIGHKVQRLRRVAFGPLRLGEIPPGQYRMLAPQEVSMLRKALTAKATSKTAGPKKRRRRTAERISAGGATADKKASYGKKPFKKKPRKLAARGKSTGQQGGGRRGRTKGRSR
jgi:23S rRNA pseudouridine2605 synthase